MSRDAFSLLQLSHRFIHLSLVYLPENRSPGLLVVSYKLANNLMIRQHTQDVQQKTTCKWSGSGKDGLLSPLLGKDGAGLVLGVWVIGQLGRAGGHGTF